MSEFSQDVLALAAEVDKSLQSAEVNQGHGNLGQWPVEEGQAKEVTASLTGVDVAAESFRYTFNGEKREAPGLLVQFHYQSDHPSGDGTSLEWPGQPIRVPAVLTDIPEAVRGRASREWGRLKGSLAGIFGTTPTNTIASLQEVNNMIAAAQKNDTTFDVLVYCDRSAYDYVARNGPNKGQRVEGYNQDDFIRDCPAR